MPPHDDLRSRKAPVDIDPDEFRRVAGDLVERIAHHLETIRDRALVLPEGKTRVVQTVLTPEPSGHRFELFSREPT